jgi:hypothetical protein
VGYQKQNLVLSTYIIGMGCYYRTSFYRQKNYVKQNLDGRAMAYSLAMKREG